MAFVITCPYCNHKETIRNTKHRWVFLQIGKTKCVDCHKEIKINDRTLKTMQVIGSGKITRRKK